MLAALSRRDCAFHWIGEVFKTDQSLDALKDAGKFVTFNAKLMSSFTNIREGDFARQLDKGRQALLMIHKIEFQHKQKTWGCLRQRRPNGSNLSQ